MKLVYSDTFPSEIEAKVLYISKLYNTSTHLCPDGCGAKVVLPLGKGGWRVENDSDKRFSLEPSIHVQSCNSHYWIYEGDILWARKMSREEARKYSERDQLLYKKEITPKTVLNRIRDAIYSLLNIR